MYVGFRQEEFYIYFVVININIRFIFCVYIDHIMMILIFFNSIVADFVFELSTL